MPITIDYLASHPQHVPTVVQWVWDEWDKGLGYTFENTQQVFGASATTSSIPLTLLALDGNKPIGLIALLKDDFINRPEFSPWGSNLYILPEYRHRRIALHLLRAAARAGRKLALPAIYFWTATPDFYRRLPECREASTDTVLGETVYIFEVDLLCPQPRLI